MTEYITITGAGENNLKGISVRIPRRQITVFTGVSGSGKSSLVFDTIAAEAQRQLYETFTAFQRNFFQSYAQPEIESIENISTAIVIDQKRIGGNSRSTVGTITDINALIRPYRRVREAGRSPGAGLTKKRRGRNRREKSSRAGFVLLSG